MRKELVIGVGPTAELSLRVSVAALARVIIPGFDDGESLLALEHKATVHLNAGEMRVDVKAQPFGGAVQILNLNGFQAEIGSFHFDSERSRTERDFRIFIRPTDLDAVQAFCLDHLYRESGSDLEVDPTRELAEEFAGTLGVMLSSDQYHLQPVKTVLEDTPVLTENVYAAGRPTVRIYRIFNTEIVDPVLCKAMAANSKNHPRHVLENLAREDAEKGGRGWANAMLVAPEWEIRGAYNAIPADLRKSPVSFKDTLLDDNVITLFEGDIFPRYRTITP